VFLDAIADVARAAANAAGTVKFMAAGRGGWSMITEWTRDRPTSVA
jgi:hypothetical protein